MIEHELYNYDETKKEIEQLKNEIIESPPPPISERVNIQTGVISDTTFNKANKIYTNSFITHMERTVRAIDRALMQLDDIHNEIFELKYRQGKNWRQVLSIAHFGQDTFFKKRRELIYQVAVNMGFVEIS